MEYHNVESLLRKKNAETFHLIIQLLACIFSGLFLGSCLFEVMAPGRPVYMIVFLIVIVMYVISRNMKGKRLRLILPLWYCLMSMMFCYAVMLNTVSRPDLPSVTFCIVIVVAPLLIIDRPYRLAMYLTGVWIIFLFTVYHTKSYYLAFVDTCNSACCLFLGIAVYLHIVKVKIRDMVHEQYLKSERDTDKLTGLLNKAAFEREAEKAVHAGGQGGALLIMDLDNFKNFNDFYGHAFGDAALRVTGECIQGCFGGKGICGRFGGDEFVLFLPAETDKDKIAQAVKYFSSVVRDKMTMPDERLRMEYSIGIAICEKADNSYEEAFGRADKALYDAKNAGKNTYRFS